MGLVTLTVQKFDVCKFKKKMLLKSLMLTKAVLFNQKYSKSSNIVKYY